MAFEGTTSRQISPFPIVNRISAKDNPNKVLVGRTTNGSHVSGVQTWIRAAGVVNGDGGRLPVRRCTEYDSTPKCRRQTKGGVRGRCIHYSNPQTRIISKRRAVCQYLRGCYTLQGNVVGMTGAQRADTSRCSAVVVRIYLENISQ